jgi:hypothetical protein
VRRAHQHWGGLRLVRLQWDQFQREATLQHQSVLEGFSIRSSQLAFDSVSVILATFLRGAPS